MIKTHGMLVILGLLFCAEVVQANSVNFNSGNPPLSVQPGETYNVSINYSTSSQARLELRFFGRKTDNSLVFYRRVDSGTLSAGSSGTISINFLVPLNVVESEGKWEVKLRNLSNQQTIDTAGTSGISVTSADYDITPGWRTLVSDGFEDSFGSWVDAGSDCKYYTYSGSGFNKAASGMNAIELQDNDSSDTDSRTYLANSFDIRSFSQIKLKFSFMAWDHENWLNVDQWRIEIYNGSSWEIVETMVNGIDYPSDETEVYYDYERTFTRADFDFSDSFNVRIICDTSHAGDDLFIDDISIEGYHEPLFVPEGFGKTSSGGSGGTVIKVTNLNDSGSGSFREAVGTSGARIIVFTVSGIITLDSPLTINNSNITIAGQTAPGDGITLENGSNNRNPTLKIKATDVIVQHLKIRTGDAMGQDLTETDVDIDCIAINSDSNRVTLDHISASWSIDEAIQVWGDAQNISIQNCIIAEPLHNNNIHPKTRNSSQTHSCAMLIGGSTGYSHGNVTVHKNLFAHAARRNPRVGSPWITEVVNNVMYNTGGESWGLLQPALMSDTVKSNFIKNAFIPGTDTGSPGFFLGKLDNLTSSSEIYVDGNSTPQGVDETSGSLQTFLVTSRISATQVDEEFTADAAYSKVLSEAGACWRLEADGTKSWRRDSLDAGWVQDVIDGTGTWQTNPGSIPSHSAGTAYTDSDNDGMPDTYEDLFSFLNKNNGSDGALDEDGDGRTNVEEFLFGTSPF
ncbi:MAG: hypothetical protein AAF558_00900 [Verrucomicrobiota bacterium]